MRDMNKQNNEWVKQTVEELRIWGCNKLADIEQLTGKERATKTDLR